MINTDNSKEAKEATETKETKILKKGYTTGSCATAATIGAITYGLTGLKVSKVKVDTPKGITLDIPLEEVGQDEEGWFCSVKKYSGDDPDVTNGTLIYSHVNFREDGEIVIDGGLGVGRVTKPGLACEIGMAAINPVPRKMITEAALKTIKVAHDKEAINEAMAKAENLGADIVISVPEGEELAKRTFNGKLGIVGGISILGTSGIVEPMSEQALIDTIKVELKVAKASGKEYIVITPGNYGTDFLKKASTFKEEQIIKCSNFIGDALNEAKDLGFKGVIFSSHLGKLIKVAGGVMNTHSKYGDRRMEFISNFAEEAGAERVLLEKINEAVMVDDAVSILDSFGLKEKTLELIVKATYENVKAKLGDVEVGVITFSNKYGLLGKTDNIDDLIDRF